MSDTETAGVVLHIPGVEVGPEDDTEMLFEQVLAQALADYEIPYDGLVDGYTIQSYDGWEAGDPCPECGNETLGEMAKAFGDSIQHDDDQPWFETNEIGDAITVHCHDCDTRLRDGVVVVDE